MAGPWEKYSVARSKSSTKPWERYAAPQANSDGTYGQPPDGMVFNPETGQMVDTAAAAQRLLNKPIGELATAGTLGATSMPIVGGLIEKGLDKYLGPIAASTGRQAMKQFEEQNPKTAMASKVGGAIAGVAPMIAAAPAAFGASGTAGFGMNTLAATGSGAVLGGLDSAIRSNGDAKSIVQGGAIGGFTGGVGPAFGKLIGGAANTLRGLNPLRTANTKAANSAIEKVVARSGKSADTLADDVARAAADGQPEFMLADALGHPGQRMLSGISRMPSDARNFVVKTLLDRQVGQGDRVANALAEGFDATDTAAQRLASFKAARSASASTNYEAARHGATPVDLSKALNTIDDALGRNPILGDSELTKSALGNKLQSFRARISKGGEQLIDFDSTLALKQDVSTTIENLRRGGKGIPPQLAKLASSLDEALEQSSGGYRVANDTFKQQSRVMDAVDIGKNSASPRNRSTDTIPKFSSMPPDAQAAFRSGYADPLLARVESASLSPTTNKVRPLLTGKLSQEIPAFAAPNQAVKLQQRLGREQTMFDTANAALGGSKTFDNLADAAEMANFDSGVIASLLSGNFKGAAIQGGAKALQRAQGINNSTRQKIADALMLKDPEAIRKGVQAAISQSGKSRAVQQQIMRALTLGPASTGGGGGY